MIWLRDFPDFAESSVRRASIASGKRSVLAMNKWYHTGSSLVPLRYRKSCAAGISRIGITRVTKGPSWKKSR
jgi:hypothetical protein